MFCERCGTKLEEGSSFCPKCGQPVSKREDTTAKTDITETVNMSQEGTTLQSTTIIEENVSRSGEPAAEVPSVPQATQDPAETQSTPQVGQNPAEAQSTPQAGQNPAEVQPAPQVGQVSVMGQPAPQPGQPMPQYAYPGNGQWQPPVPKKKASGKVIGIILGIIGLCIALIVVLVMFLNRPTVYNLEDYVTFDYGGFNGQATARVYLRSGDLEEDFLKQKFKGKDINSYANFSKALKYSMQLEEVLDYVEVEMTSDSTELSNGDVLEAKITYDNKKAKKLKIKFTGESVFTTVDGLADIREVDPFADLEVTFSGTEPDGYLQYNYTGSEAYMPFSFDKTSGLSNGEEVTVTVALDDTYTLSQGYRLTRTEETYVVAGLSGYAGSFGDLSFALGNIKTTTKDKITEYITNNYSEYVTTTPLEEVGYVFEKRNPDTDYWGDENILYYIYKTTLTHEQEEFDPVDVYFPMRYSNFLMDDQGVVTEFIVGDLQGYTSIPVHEDVWNSYNTKGYLDPVACFIDLTEDLKEDYTIERGGDLVYFDDYGIMQHLNDISIQGKEPLEQRAQELLETSFESAFGDDHTLTDVTVVGDCLYYGETDYYGPGNYYCVVLSGTVSPKNKKAYEPTVVYFPVEFDDVYALGDGNAFMKDSNALIVLGKCELAEEVYVSGYTDVNVMLEELEGELGEAYDEIEISDALRSLQDE